MNFSDAKYDERLIGASLPPNYEGSSWDTWTKCAYGIPIDDDEAELVKQCTGLEPHQLSPDGYRENVVIGGRRSGKSLTMAHIAAYEARFRNHKEHLAPGEKGLVLLLAADRAQSKTLLHYIKGTFSASQALADTVVADVQWSLELDNRILIEVQSSNYKSIRGRTIVCAVADEIAFWPQMGCSPDVEVIRALRPAMATVPGAKLFVISSPYARRGWLFETWRDWYGIPNDRTLVWWAPTAVMNPTVPADFIARECEKDPVSGQSEYYAQWRSDIESFLSLDSITACATLPGNMPPEKGLVYYAFCDASGGRSDSFTMAVGHQDYQTSLLYVDYLRAWEAPFDPSVVVSEIAQVLRDYGVSKIVGDKYGAQWVSSQFEKSGIIYEPSPRPKSDLYLAAEGFFNSGRLQIPKNETLINELLALERRTSRSGRDVVDHPSTVGAHDDLANSVCGLAYLLTELEGSFFKDCNLS